MAISEKSYGKRIKIEFVDEDGTIQRVKVPRSDVKKWEHKRKALRHRVVRVNIAGVTGKAVEEWKIGEQVTIEDVEKWCDPETRELYIEQVFEEGKLQQRFVKKPSGQDLNENE